MKPRTPWPHWSEIAIGLLGLVLALLQIVVPNPELLSFPEEVTISVRWLLPALSLGAAVYFFVRRAMQPRWRWVWRGLACILLLVTTISATTLHHPSADASTSMPAPVRPTALELWERIAPGVWTVEQVAQGTGQPSWGNLRLYAKSSGGPLQLRFQWGRTSGGQPRQFWATMRTVTVESDTTIRVSFEAAQDLAQNKQEGAKTRPTYKGSATCSRHEDGLLCQITYDDGSAASAASPYQTHVFLRP